MVLILLQLIAFSGTSQEDHRNCIGLRFGLGSGITFQHHITDAHAVEVIAFGRYGGFNFVGLYEFSGPAFTEGLRWYIGIGGHVGIYNDRARYFENEHGNSTTLGADGIIGIEYTLSDIPLCVSVDWKPSATLLSTSHLFNDWNCAALSVRYRF